MFLGKSQILEQSAVPSVWCSAILGSSSWQLQMCDLTRRVRGALRCAASAAGKSCYSSGWKCQGSRYCSWCSFLPVSGNAMFWTCGSLLCCVLFPPNFANQQGRECKGLDFPEFFVWLPNPLNIQIDFRKVLNNCGKKDPALLCLYSVFISLPIKKKELSVVFSALNGAIVSPAFRTAVGEVNGCCNINPMSYRSLK